MYPFDQITILTYSMYSDRQDWANDLDYVYRQTGLSERFRPRSEPQSEASDQDLYCLPFILQFSLVHR